MEANLAIKKAVLCLGSAAELARRLGITKAAVRQWRSDVPAEHCPAIERVTGGAVRCEELNRKTDWAYLRGTLDLTLVAQARPQPLPAVEKLADVANVVSVPACDRGNMVVINQQQGVAHA